MIDQDFINELLELPKREAKDKLAEYALQFNIELKKNFTIEDMIENFKAEIKKLADEPMPEDPEDGLSLSELMDEEGSRIDVQIDTPQTTAPELLIEPVSSPDLKVIDVQAEIETVQSGANAEQKQEEIITFTPVPTVEKVKIDFGTLLPKDFSPTVTLIGPTPGYANIPYWVYDFIVQNPNWKLKIDKFKHTNDHKILYSLLYFINKNGSVKIRESRNSGFHVIQ